MIKKWNNRNALQTPALASVLLLSLVVVGWLSCTYLDFDRSVWLQAYLGYWFCLLATGLAMGFGLRAFLRARAAGEGFRLDRYGVCAIGLAVIGTWIIFLHWPMEMRVFNDEPSHALVADSMAQERIVAAPRRGNYEGGAFVTAEPFPVYRLYYYPFVVSLLHNITGERLFNLHVVNILATFGLLCAAYLGGRWFSRCYLGGYLAQGLLLSSPLLGYVASSANYDSLNLFFFSIFILSCLRYLEAGGSERLDLAISIGILFAYCRSESILYLGLLAVIFGIRTWREHRLELSVYASLSPLFLVVPVVGRILGQRLSDTLTLFYGHVETGFFSAMYIAGNARQALHWFFSSDPGCLNSLFLSGLGVVCVILLPVATYYALRERTDGGASPARFDVVLYALWILVIGHLVLLLSLYWDPTEASALRFFLPLHLLAALTVARVAGWLEKLAPCRILSVALFICAVFFWSSTLPKAARGEMRKASIAADFATKSLDWVERNDGGRTLYVVKSTHLFILNEYPAITIGELNKNIDRLREIMNENLYENIHVIDMHYLNPATNQWEQSYPIRPLSDSIQTETIAVWRGYLEARTTVENVIAFKDPSGEVFPLKADGREKNQFDSAKEYFDYIRSLHL